MSTDIFADIEAAADSEKESRKIDLGPVSKLANQQAKLEAKVHEKTAEVIHAFVKKLGGSVADVEEALKMRKKDLFNIRQVQIPELMKEFGLDALTTTDGSQIKIMDGISVSVRDPDKFFKYLRDNNAGDLIKNQVIVQVTNEEKRKEVIALLEETDFAFEAKESVHAATLKRYVKDRLAEGIKVPEDIVNTFEYQFSKIK